MRQKVAEAKCTNLPLRVKLLHSAPSLKVESFPVLTRYIRYRPVNQEHVNVIRPQCLKSPAEGFMCSVVAHVSFPDFGGYEKLFTGYSALSQSLAKSAFRAVERCCVEVAITCLNCEAHSFLRRLVRTEAHNGNLRGIIQRKMQHVNYHLYAV